MSDAVGAVADGLSELASAVEWGLNAVVWQLQQQHETLRSIDLTLKTPTATQANEWRQIADELCSRGALAQAEEFYTKALAAYPLDYRSYVGLASTYLKSNQFDRARDTLERSLSHAPAENGFNWKSHSYRLIGHIYSCEENYPEAARLLGLAVDLSPRSAEAHYDNALYCANTGDLTSVSKSLSVAIEGSPKYWRTSAVARDFRSIRPHVERTRIEFLKGGRDSLGKAIASAQKAIASANNAVADAMSVNERLKMLRARPNDLTWGPEATPLACATSVEEATRKLGVATSAKPDDYINCLDAADVARQARNMATQAAEMATLQRSQLLARLEDARNTLLSERKEFISNFVTIGWSASGVAYLFGSVGGCFGRIETPGHTDPVSGFLYPLGAFISVGFVWALGAGAVTAIIAALKYTSLEPIPSRDDGHWHS